MNSIASTKDRWLRADFHEMEDDNRITLRVAESIATAFNQGDWIVLYDSDGVNYRAYVTRRVDNLLECLVDIGRSAKAILIPDFLTTHSEVQQHLIAAS